MKKGRRRKLGEKKGLINRERVYRIDEGLEIDDVESYSVTRRRVYFSDVMMIARGVRRGGVFPWIAGVFALIFTVISFFVGRQEPVVGWFLFAIIALPFALALALRLIIGNHIVSVWGKRSRAIMHFGIRRGRAERVYRDLLGVTTSFQRRLARQVAVEEGESSPSPRQQLEP